MLMTTGCGNNLQIHLTLSEVGQGEMERGNSCRAFGTYVVFFAGEGPFKPIEV